jgi:hypothetical protein
MRAILACVFALALSSAATAADKVTTIKHPDGTKTQIKTDRHGTQVKHDWGTERARPGTTCGGDCHREAVRREARPGSVIVGPRKRGEEERPLCRRCQLQQACSWFPAGCEKWATRGGGPAFLRGLATVSRNKTAVVERKRRAAIQRKR